MKTLAAIVALLSTSLVQAGGEEETTALERFLAAKPPYGIEAGSNAYLALLDIRRQRGFARRGFALGSARLWEEKLLEISKTGDVDNALDAAGHPGTKVYDLLYLGRGWTVDFKSTAKDKETQKVFRSITQKIQMYNKSEQATSSKPSD